MLQQFSALGIFFVVALAFAVVTMVVAWVFRPKRPNPVKLETYECGVPTQGTTWVQFKVSYFLYALVFLIFDVEILFLFPWAVKFQWLGLFAFIEMIIFIGILVMGLWYAWREGALEWK